MLNEELKNLNRELYEDDLKFFLNDMQEEHMVTVYRDDECVFRERIPVFLRTTNYQVWGEYQVVIMWEDSSGYSDRRQYNADGLHGMYSSNFVPFELDETGNVLKFYDGDNMICIVL